MAKDESIKAPFKKYESIQILMPQSSARQHHKSKEPSPEYQADSKPYRLAINPLYNIFL
jgi:hypothetical protein